MSDGIIKNGIHYFDCILFLFSIQNEWGLKICAQSGSDERKLTELTEPIKKKITQTEPATSEKPIQKAIVLLEYDIIVLFVFF